MKVTDPTKQLTPFQLGYMEAALWTTMDADGEPIEEAIIDLAPETVAAMIADCDKFVAENAADLAGENMERAGHDFWFTRNGHGAGYWDGDYEKSKGERLTEACRKYKERNLYVGDDGQVYQEQA